MSIHTYERVVHICLYIRMKELYIYVYTTVPFGVGTVPLDRVPWTSVLQCVAVCCSVLQCVAVWFEVDLSARPPSSFIHTYTHTHGIQTATQQRWQQVQFLKSPHAIQIVV